MEKKIEFEYENIFVYTVVYVLFILCLGALILYLFGKISDIVPVDYKKTIASIMVVVFIFAAAIVMRIPGLITYKKGTAKFYEKYFELYYNGIEQKFFYSDIKDVEIKRVGYPLSQVKNSKVVIKTNNGKISFQSAHKEENYKKEYEWTVEHYSLTKMGRELESRINRVDDVNMSTKVDILIESANNYWINTKAPNYSRVEELYKQALAKKPNNIETLTMYAELLFEMERTDEADAMYERACKIDKRVAESVANHYQTLGYNSREKYWRDKMKR